MNIFYFKSHNVFSHLSLYFLPKTVGSATTNDRFYLKNGRTPQSRCSNNSTNEKLHAVTHWQMNVSLITLQHPGTDERKLYYAASIRRVVVFTETPITHPPPYGKAIKRCTKPANKFNSVVCSFVLLLLPAQETGNALCTPINIYNPMSTFSLKFQIPLRKMSN